MYVWWFLVWYFLLEAKGCLASSAKEKTVSCKDCAVWGCAVLLSPLDRDSLPFVLQELPKKSKLFQVGELYKEMWQMCAEWRIIRFLLFNVLVLLVY